jgi:hypothetical protein
VQRSTPKREQLCLLLNSRNPIITVETNEEQRFSELLERAEIEQAIISTLYTAFSQKSQLSTAILLSELQSTQP